MYISLTLFLCGNLNIRIYKGNTKNNKCYRPHLLHSIYLIYEILHSIHLNDILIWSQHSLNRKEYHKSNKLIKRWATEMHSRTCSVYIFAKLCLNRFLKMHIWCLDCMPNTLPTAEILSGKNARAWVSMILYLKR